MKSLPQQNLNSEDSMYNFPLNSIQNSEHFMEELFFLKSLA